jgi:hypothetical protein
MTQTERCRVMCEWEHELGWPLAQEQLGQSESFYVLQQPYQTARQPKKSHCFWARSQPKMWWSSRILLLAEVLSISNIVVTVGGFDHAWRVQPKSYETNPCTECTVPGFGCSYCCQVFPIHQLFHSCTSDSPTLQAFPAFPPLRQRRRRGEALGILSCIQRIPVSHTQGRLFDVKMKVSRELGSSGNWNKKLLFSLW